MNNPTDQFSPEYIAHILSDEAKGLQEVWRRNGVSEGDHCVGTNRDTGGVRGVVHRHRLQTTDGGMAAGFAVSENLNGTLHWYCNKDKRIPEDWAWLAGLYDLLQIIEGAGVRISIFAPEEYSEHWLIAGDRVGESADDRDLMLAAAKLAVRAIGERMIIVDG